MYRRMLATAGVLAWIACACGHPADAPAPPPPAAPRPAAPPPPPVPLEKSFKARVIGVEVHGSGAVITFGAGKDRGIDRRHAHATLIDRSDKPLPYGNCPIERVMERTSQCLLAATFDQIRGFGFVLVTLD